MSLNSSSQAVDVSNDAVIVQIGGTAPTAILKSFGIELVTKYGQR